MSDKSDVVIHLGLHKTGTTFLQKNVFPLIKNVNLICRPISFGDFCIKKDMLNIISNEGFSFSMPHLSRCSIDYQKNVLLCFKKLFPDAKIIVGVRNRDSWLKSCYSEYIRASGGFISFDKYVEKFGNYIIDMDDYVSRILCLWDNVFVYRQESLYDDVSSMCVFMGCVCPSFERKVIRQSFSKNQIFILRFINFCVPSIFYSLLSRFLKVINKEDVVRL